MIARWLVLLGFTLLPLLVTGAEPSARASAFGKLPDWTGIWETEAASRLVETGVFTPSELWARPPYGKEWEALGQRAAAPSVDLPPATKVCGPSGFPAAMAYPVPIPFEMLVTPEQVLLVSADGTIRHVYTDGRSHPDAAELWGTTTGHSIGHWEGDTLVIDTVARAAGPVGPVPEAAELSERAHFIERLRRTGADTLENRMTITDPERFAEPWQIVIRYRRVADIDRLIAEGDCQENDRNPVVDGRFVITPP